MSLCLRICLTYLVILSAILSLIHCTIGRVIRFHRAGTLPGHDDAETSRADPGSNHEGSMEIYQQFGLGSYRANLAQASQSARNNLGEEKFDQTVYVTGKIGHHLKLDKLSECLLTKSFIDFLLHFIISKLPTSKIIIEFYTIFSSHQLLVLI